MIRRSLASLALMSSLLMPNGLARAEGSKLEIHNKKPHEVVQKYLDGNGVAREQFRSNHYLFKDRGGNLFYNRRYLFGKDVFIEQYDMANIMNSSKDGKFRMLYAYPSYFFFRGTWYFDPLRDGFNGNEIKHENSREPFKPKKPLSSKSGPKKGFSI